jgi:hypothetical protein
MYTTITEFRPVLDTSTIHPARIAAANGKRNPYDAISQPRSCHASALRRALCFAWERDSKGWTQPNKMLHEANELTRIQLATR